LNILSDDTKSPNTVVFGEVIGIHIEDDFLIDGKIDLMKLKPIGRLGYLDFVEVNNSFSLERPDWDTK